MRAEDATGCELGFAHILGQSSKGYNRVEPPMHSLLSVSVGIIVRNEERNILNLLRSISDQKLKGLVIDEVIVVSSGPEDRTNELVLKYTERDRRVCLIVQNGVKGKASAINKFLKISKNDIVVISSGDVIFNEKTLQNLISPLIKDEKIGLSSAKPIPINDSHSFMGTVANIHWRLHRVLERHGETLAFRKNLVNHIPDEVSADEAYIEAIVRRKAFAIVQASDSFIFNKGSESILEFLNQIRRHYAGHLFIKARLSYVVSSMTIGGLLKTAEELLKCVRESPSKVNHVVGYVILEATGRVLGIWDFYVKKRHYRVWSAAQTTKILNKKDGEWSGK